MKAPDKREARQVRHLARSYRKQSNYTTDPAIVRGMNYLMVKLGFGPLSAKEYLFTLFFTAALIVFTYGACLFMYVCRFEGWPW